ncbi:MAG: glycosyltransferase family 32 protein [Candidatus Sericytochromatia bacterium]
MGSRSGVRKIPNNIIVFWHDKRHLPVSIREAVRSTMAIHPDYHLIFADDASMHVFIKKHYHPDMLALYQAIRIPAARSDIARLMLLYRFGGIYLDAAMEMIRPLDDYLSADDELAFILRDDMPPWDASRPERGSITNSLIAAVPGSPMLKSALALAVSHLNSGVYNRQVWFATGPYCLNLHLEKYEALCKIVKLQFSQLENQLFVYRRVQGISNQWAKDQYSGILEQIPMLTGNPYTFAARADEQAVGSAVLGSDGTAPGADEAPADLASQRLHPGGAGGWKKVGYLGLDAWIARTSKKSPP